MTLVYFTSLSSIKGEVNNTPCYSYRVVTVDLGGVIFVSLFCFVFFFFADKTDIKSVILLAVVHGVPAKIRDYSSSYGWRG